MEKVFSTLRLSLTLVRLRYFSSHKLIVTIIDHIFVSVSYFINKSIKTNRVFII